MPTHLTIVERDRLAQLRTEGYSQKEIAEQLNRHASTISRELTRNCTGEKYYAARLTSALSNDAAIGRWRPNWRTRNSTSSYGRGFRRPGRRSKSPTVGTSN